MGLITRNFFFAELGVELLWLVEADVIFDLFIYLSLAIRISH